MKILVIPTWHPTKEKPLFCTWILAHIEALKSVGHDVYVLHIDVEPTNNQENLGKKDFIEESSSNHLFSKLYIKNSKFYRTRFFYKKALNSYTTRLFEMYEKMKESWGEPDVIHAHVSLYAGYGSSLLGKKHHIPVVVTEHYSGFESDAKYFWRVGAFAKEMSKKIQGFYAVSKAFANRIENTKLVEVTGVLPNPVDTDIFYLRDEKKESDTFEIVTAGSATNIKGIDILLDSLNLLDDNINWHLTLFGNYNNIDKYKHHFKKDFDKKITIVGKVPQEELAKAYSKSNLYIVSSRSETANVSMLEAMACGLPVITTICGGPESLINDKVGITIPSENPKALAEAIKKVYNSKENYKKEDLINFIIDNYSKEAVAQKMSKAYYEAINKLV